MNPFAREVTAGVVAVLVLGLSGCGSDSEGPAGPPAGPPENGTPSGPVATTSVSVEDDLFDPSAIRVSGGATVTWTWAGNEEHNVTWEDPGSDPDDDDYGGAGGQAGGGMDNSPSQTSGTHQVTMPSQAGVYVYYCTFHGSPTTGMRGTVEVEG
jgi:large repetitive protein